MNEDSKNKQDLILELQHNLDTLQRETKLGEELLVT
jgi:hypothetical protein